MGETADVGRRAGMLYSLNGIVLLAGTPVSGAIINKTGSYQGAGIFAGMLAPRVNFFILHVRNRDHDPYLGAFALVHSLYDDRWTFQRKVLRCYGHGSSNTPSFLQYAQI
jgi:hypothetical protein